MYKKYFAACCKRNDNALFRLLIMVKVTLVIIMVSVMQAGATAYAQKASIRANQAVLTDVFNELRKQTGFHFLYLLEDIKDAKPVSLDVTNAPLEEILQQIFKDQPLTYEIRNKRILVERKELPPSPLVLEIQSVQQTVVSGKVNDENGQPLEGVTVGVKNTQIGTMTDSEGNYRITLPEKEGVLLFSTVGFESKEIVVSSNATINVTLVAGISDLEEVVVVGYGTQKKVNLTGAVDVISGDQLENRSATNVADLIKGTSPNLNITMNMRGGEPGATSSWNIRGVGSIHGNASPLILVDGVEMNIHNVDPESIESISVLKDASAAAIYGSRAPFGVILITTKKGKTGQAQIQYNNNLSLASPIKVPSLVNSLTWATAFNQANANAGLTPVYGAEQIERIQGYLDGTFQDEYDPEDPPPSIWSGRQMGNANNDWPKLLMKDLSFNQKHSVSISGGSEKTQYYASGSYVDQDGVYSYGYDDYKRYNFLTNFSSQITDWLKFNSSVKYASGQTDYPVGQTTVTRDNFFVAALQFAPVTPFYNINGTVQHPIVAWSQGTGRDKTQTSDFLLALGSEIEPIKGWKTNFSYNYNLIGNRNSANPKPVLVEVGTGEFGNIGKPSSGYTTFFNQDSYQMVNVVTSYELSMNDHYFKPLLGYEQENRYFSGIEATGVNLITEEVPSLSTSLGEKTVDDQIYHWATQGIFGRLNYNYKEKFLFEFSARYNGSSRFAEDSRWGFFPSASIGYNLSNESFWTPVSPYVNMFKIRGSYGSLGNQNVNNYMYLSTIPVTNELNWILDDERPPYATVPSLISDRLTWETITTLNLGLDAAFLNNRLTFTLDWYDRRSTDMIGPSITLPYVLGAGAPQTNNAELKTRGFELLLSWEDRVSDKFSYNLGIGLGDNKSEILEYENEKGVIDTWYKGKQVGEIWGFESDGLIQTTSEQMPDQSKYHANWGPGDMKYKDKDGNDIINDGTRTLDDHGDLVVIGNSSARYNIGITAGFKWKDIDFNMFWQGVGKRNYYPGNYSMAFWGLTRSWGSSSLFEKSPSLDYWRPDTETNLLGPNTDAYFAKPYFSAETDKNRQVQSRYVLNAAYLRLKNVQIGYTFPDKILNNSFFRGARIYFSGENLLLLSKLPKVFDPETAFASDTKYGGYSASGVIYPIFSSFSLGFNLTF